MTPFVEKSKLYDLLKKMDVFTKTIHRPRDLTPFHQLKHVQLCETESCIIPLKKLKLPKSVVKLSIKTKKWDQLIEFLENHIHIVSLSILNPIDEMVSFSHLNHLKTICCLNPKPHQLPLELKELIIEPLYTSHSMNTIPSLEWISSFIHLEKLEINTDSAFYTKYLTNTKLVHLEYMGPKFEYDYVLPTTLKTIILYQVQNLKFLFGLKNLETLIIQKCDQEKVSFEETPNLHTLIFPAKNFDFLSHLKQLKILDIQGSTIQNLNTLPFHESLHTLSLSCTKIENLDGITQLKNLTILDISYNKIENLEPLKHLTHLKQLIS